MCQKEIGRETTGGHRGVCFAYGSAMVIHGLTLILSSVNRLGENGSGGFHRSGGVRRLNC